MNFYLKTFSLRMLLPSLVKIHSEDFFQKQHPIFHYFHYLHSEESGPTFDQTLIPFTQVYFVRNLVEIGPLRKVLNLTSKLFIFIISPLKRACPFILINTPFYLRIILC